MDLTKPKFNGGKGMGRPMDISLTGEDQYEETTKFGEIYLERVYNRREEESDSKYLCDTIALGLPDLIK